MSFAGYSRYEQHDSNGNSFSHSSIIVHELTDGEINALLMNRHIDATGLSPSMLRAPQPDYEIESGASDAEYDSDAELTTEDDDDEWITDHWFPSLLRKSIIEYLDDDEDAVMLDDRLVDVLSSSEVAEVEEEYDGEQQKHHDDDDDGTDEPEISGHQRHSMPSPRKRYKHRHRHGRHADEEQQQQQRVDRTTVPVVVRIIM